MVVRLLFPLLTAMLLGVTLLAPMVVAVEDGADTTQPFKITTSDSTTLPTETSDPDGEDFNAPLAIALGLPAPFVAVSAGSLQSIVMLFRFAERPPARASPANL